MISTLDQALAKLSLEEKALLDAARQAGIKPPASVLNATLVAQLDVLAFGEREFYIPETGRPLEWVPVQKVLLPIIAGTHHYPKLLPFYNTIYWTTPKKMAKALAIDTPIPTAMGWKRIADVEVGDVLFDEQGKLCNVTLVTEIMHGHSCYRLTFADKSTVVADADHQWQVTAVYGRGIGAIPIVKTTKELYQKYKNPSGSPIWKIPLAEPLRLPDISLSIDPYVLGAWLGDGTSSNATFTCCDPQILEEIEKAGVSVKEQSHNSRAPTFLLGGAVGGRYSTYEAKQESLSAKLRELGVLNNKHIPIEYKWATVQQRLSLLQGLMDTDGTIYQSASGTPQCAFSVTNKQLAMDVRELIRGLGFKCNMRVARAMLNGKDCGDYYRLFFNAPSDIPVFRLDRKASRQLARSSMQHMSRSIVNIEPVESVPVKCIQVDSPSHLFLCTESLIPTHNTSTSGCYARWRAESVTLNDEILFFANDEQQSRGRAYEAITKSIELNPHYDKQKRVLFDKDGNAVWRIIEDYLEHIPTRTRVRAVNVDYRGEAGANPTLSIWTEVWGYDSTKQENLFDEMTDVLTRERSQRYLEGYAGYIGKSKIQKKVEDLLIPEADKGGRRLTLADLMDWPGIERLAADHGDKAPDQIELPVYVNDTAGVFGFIDRDEIARTRWSWCMGPEAEAYYRRQSITLTPEQYDRLHLNHWVSPVTAFLPIEWHTACEDASLSRLEPYREPILIKDVPQYGEKDELGRDLLREYMRPDNWLVVGASTPCVLSADASVAGDCTALSMFTRHPVRHQDVVHRRAYKWDPPRGGKLDYLYTPCSRTGLSLLQTIVKLCMEYNVVQLGYDEWQLHHLMNELRQWELTWCRPFSQATARDVADKQLYDLIKERRYSYTKNEGPELDLDSVRQHIQNAARKQRAGEDTKLHIIKAAEEGKIDLVITMSMGTSETLRLDI